MNLSFFARGLLIGFSIAATVGPMSLLCMQRTLQKGQLYGLVSGLGIATADAVYGSIAGFGLTIVASFLVQQQLWIRVIGGIFLIYLGLKTVLSEPAPGAAATKTPSSGWLGAFVSTFLLTLTNPLTILSFAAVFAGLGVGITGTNKSYVTAFMVVLGVFAGSALWWLLLTSALRLLRARLTPRWLRWINRGSGAMLVIFGVVALLL